MPTLHGHEIRQSQENISTTVLSRPPIPLVFAKQSKTKSKREKAIGLTIEEALGIENEKTVDLLQGKTSFDNLELVSVEPHQHVEMQDEDVLEGLQSKPVGSDIREEYPKEETEKSKLSKNISFQSITVGSAVNCEESSPNEDRNMLIEKTQKTETVLPKTNTHRSVSVVQTTEDAKFLGITDHKEEEARLSTHTVKNKNRGKSMERLEGQHIRQEIVSNLGDGKSNHEKGNKVDIRIKDNHALVGLEHWDISDTSDFDQNYSLHQKRAITKTHANKSKESAGKNTTIQGEDGGSEVVENIKKDESQEIMGKTSVLSNEAPIVFSQNKLESTEPLEELKILVEATVDSETLHGTSKQNVKKVSKILGQSRSQEQVSDLEDLKIKPQQATIQSESNKTIKQINNVGIVVGYGPNKEDIISEISQESLTARLKEPRAHENEVSGGLETVILETAPKITVTHETRNVNANEIIVPYDANIGNETTETLEKEEQFKTGILEINPSITQSKASSNLEKTQQNTTFQGFDVVDLNVDELKLGRNDTNVAQREFQSPVAPITIEKVVDTDFLDSFTNELSESVSSIRTKEPEKRDAVKYTAVVSGVGNVDEEAEDIAYGINQEKRNANLDIEHESKPIIVEQRSIGERTEKLQKTRSPSKKGYIGRQQSSSRIVESKPLQLGIGDKTENVKSLDTVENKPISNLVSNIKRTKHSPVRSPVSKMVIVFSLTIVALYI